MSRRKQKLNTGDVVLRCLLCASWTVLASCQAATQRAPYHVVLVNETDAVLKSVTISFGNFRFNYGALAANAPASCMFVNEREFLPREATLSWEELDGARMEKSVAFKGAPQDYTNLYVTVAIGPGGSLSASFTDRPLP